MQIDIKDKYYKLFSTIAENNSKIGKYQLTGFSYMVGDLYKGDLFVVGRSVNGWTDGYLPEELLLKKNQDNFLNSIITSTENKESCPMNWIIDAWGTNKHHYNTKRSAFWRVIRKLIVYLSITSAESENWSSYLSWSNLYKISPCNGGNPANYLCSLQFDICYEILLLELYNLMPKKILLLTGWDWANWFLNRMNLQKIEIMDSIYIDWTGFLKINSTKNPIPLVVAKHPQGKPENNLVKDIFNSFTMLCTQHL